MDELIARLNDRIRFSPAVELDAHCVRTNEFGEILSPRPPNRKLALADVKYVEHQLGFALPDIVRRLSMEVADGGYGPNWGINRLKHPPHLPFGPFWEVKMSVESWHRLYRDEHFVNETVAYPSRFIRFCEVGCNISICVDCKSQAGSLFIDDPNKSSDQIEPMKQSIEEWLWEWLNRTPWPDKLYS